MGTMFGNWGLGWGKMGEFWELGFSVGENRGNVWELGILGGLASEPLPLSA